MLIGARTKRRPAKASGVLVFMSGHQAEKIAIGFSLKRLCLAAVVAQADAGKDTQAAASKMPGARVVFGFKAVERGQGNSESAVQVAEDFKDLGFELVVGALRFWCGFGLLGLRLRG